MRHDITSSIESPTLILWKPYRQTTHELFTSIVKLSDSSCFSTSSTSSLERSNTGTNIFMGNYYPSSSYTSLAGETNVVGWGGVCTNMAFTSHCWDGWALGFRTLPCTPNAHDDETFHSAYVLLVINGWWGRSDFDRISLDRRAFFINVEANRPKGIRKGCRRVRFTCSFSESRRNFFSPQSPEFQEGLRVQRVKYWITQGDSPMTAFEQMINNVQNFFIIRKIIPARLPRLFSPFICVLVQGILEA